MLLSLNWIKDFVDLDGISTDEIVKRYILSTAEIEEIIHKGQDTTGVVFAKILEVKAHPDSQKLHILRVDKGDEVVQIVCGAPNVREGMITALATIGGKVCGHKISKARLAGVDSYGMCCAEDELGIGSDDTGIIDVKDKVVIGQDIKEYWPIDDIIIDIDNKSLTNRPDLWGHYGHARELAAIFGRKLKPLQLEDLSQYNSLNKIKVNVEDKNCFRYSAIAVDNVNVKVSPMTMKIRLNYIGQRDINLLADLTNYLMYEVGQPMHAFDHKVVSCVNVITNKPKDQLLTLEGEKHDIPEGSILIADEQRQPVAIAGVKGGMLSGITEETSSLLLESATFDSASIRKTSIAVGLRTDSSLRYEKSLDPELTVLALRRFLYLLKNIDSGIKVVSSLADVYTYRYPERVISITADFIARRTGISIEENDIIEVLKSLEFGVEKKGSEIVVTVPSFRATKDISIKEDLVEEVARMYGYDNIKPTSIQSMTTPVMQSKELTCEYQTKCLLAEKFGLNEVHSYLWNYVDFNKTYGIYSPSYVNLVDSSNSGQSGIRSSMIPTMLKFFEENKNSYNDIGIFEIGRVISGLNEDKTSIEQKHLTILLASTTKSIKDMYFGLKNIVLNICKTVTCTQVDFVTGSDNKNLHPVNSCTLTSNNTTIGTMGNLHPSIVIDKRFNVCVLELDFANLCALEEKIAKIKPISKYQAVDLDFNFVADKSMEYGEIIRCLDLFRAKYNMAYSLKDIYENDQVLPNKRSYTFAYTISSNDHTLTSEEIEKFSTRLINHIKSNNIVLR